MVSLKTATLRGNAVSQGIAIGILRRFVQEENLIVEREITEDEISLEQERYREALKLAKESIVALKLEFEGKGLAEAAIILETHLEILEDPILTEEIWGSIAEFKKNAEHVFSDYILRYQKRFSRIKDPFFRERGKDLQDISRRVLGFLHKSGVKNRVSSLGSNAIVYSEDIAASDVAEADPKQVLAFVSEGGGNTSHAAIIAKARGIPYITNIKQAEIDSCFGEQIIVDGRSGLVILNPTVRELDRYRLIEAKMRSIYNDLEKHCTLRSETKDGYAVNLSANVEMVGEIDELHRYGVEGVGLFRSEYIFLSRQSFPSEEEQYLIYSRIVEKMKGLPVVIRTFDVGGDKYIVDQKAPHEENPYLGCRAIRFLLKEKEIFKTQLRAILRASVMGKVSILFPMISDLSELLEAKEIIAEVQEELWPATKKVESNVRIGCMIEVPSAAMITDLLAKECDFLAIGTNDLVQYLLAVDRGNQSINKLYTPMHPALIRMIKLIVTQASEHGVPVSVCGEVAGDPRFTPLLLGLGVNELSVSLKNYPLIKKTIRHTSIIRAHSLTNEAIGLSTPEEVRDLLVKEYEHLMPEDCHHLTLN